MTPDRPDDATPPPDRTRIFHLLVANTLVASVTNNFLWFALTFWVYLETLSVLATAIIGGGYMLLVAISGMAFGTFVDRHLRQHVDAPVECRSRWLPSRWLRSCSHSRRRVVVPRPGQPGLLGARRARARRRDRGQPARGRALDDGHAARARRRPRSGERPCGHRERARVRDQRRCSAASPSGCSGWAGRSSSRWHDRARDRPSPVDPDSGSAAAAKRGRGTLHRLPRRLGAIASFRAACPAPLLDIQQLPGRRVHVADGPVWADSRVRRGVGNRDGLHHALGFIVGGSWSPGAASGAIRSARCYSRTS